MVTRGLRLMRKKLYGGTTKYLKLSIIEYIMEVGKVWFWGHSRLRTPNVIFSNFSSIFPFTPRFRTIERWFTDLIFERNMKKYTTDLGSWFLDLGFWIFFLGESLSRQRRKYEVRRPAILNWRDFGFRILDLDFNFLKVEVMQCTEKTSISP